MRFGIFMALLYLSFKHFGIAEHFLMHFTLAHLTLYKMIKGLNVVTNREKPNKYKAFLFILRISSIRSRKN